MRTKTTTILLFATILPSTLAAIHRIQCFSEQDCQGDSGRARELHDDEEVGLCLNTAGRKSCSWEDGYDNNLSGRFLGCSSCNDGLACDLPAGCSSGAPCVNLMHPNGNYFDFSYVTKAGSAPCWTGSEGG